MSWLSNWLRHPLDLNTNLRFLGVGTGHGSSASAASNLPGPTDAEVLASDLRLRRRLATQKGQASTLITGGLGAKPAKLTLPSLVGI
jgi:hypothetical protein